MADAAAKDRQNIIDAFDKGTGGRRQASEEEIARFMESSDYQLQKYINFLPERIYSQEYMDRFLGISSSFEGMFGVSANYSRDNLLQIDRYVRDGVGDNQILAGWRASNMYRDIYAGKPLTMTETQYRTIKEKMTAEAPQLQQDFSAYTGRNLTQDDMNKIYFGGEGSDQIRKEYTNMQGVKASMEATRGKRLNTQVQITPGGPVQPLMREKSSAVGSSVTQPQTAQLPPTERFTTYKDYKQGIVNPEYERRATPFKV